MRIEADKFDFALVPHFFEKLVGRATGLFLNGSFPGLYLGHLFVATPYVVGTVVAVLQRFNVRLEEAALSLGASPWRTFRRVTLPTIMPGVHAGALYASMVSFADVPIAMFLTAPGFVTYPVELFFGIESDFSPSSFAASRLLAAAARRLSSSSSSPPSHTGPTA